MATPAPATAASPTSAAPSSPSTVSSSAPSSSAAAASHPQYSDAWSSPTPSSDSTNTSKKSDWRLYQYYFAFLALLVIVVIITSWLLFRRKRRIAQLSRASRQNALSRDLEGTNAGRGWTYTDWRIRDVMPSAWRSREEGLNEAGEAPPPDKARSRDGNEAVVLEAGQHVPSPGETEEPMIPLRTLDREQAGLKPPDYSEAIATQVSADAEGRGPSSSGASGTAATAPPGTGTSGHG